MKCIYDTVTSINHFSIFFIFLLTPFPTYALFDYDRGVAAGLRGDAQKALGLLEPLISNNPHNVTQLYDAGVAAYKANQYDRAQIYFEHVLAQPTVTVPLKEKAHFNLGNTFVSLKKYEAAIEQYEKALAISPDNKQAKHNLEVVKKMLEQQKQQEQQQQQDEKQDKNDKQQQEKKQQQKQDSQEQQNQDKQQESQGQQDKKDEQQEGSQQQDDKHKESQQQSEEQQEKQAQRENNTQQQEQDQQRRNEEEKKAREEQAAREEKQQAAQQKQAGQKEQQKLEPVLARILDESEEHDAQVHRQVIKAKVSKDMAGRNGQNNR